MPELFTAQQLAEYLQLSKRTVYRLVERHQLPAVRVGGQWRFPKSAVNYWLDMRLGVLGTADLDALEADAAGPTLALRSVLSEVNARIPLRAGSVSDIVRSFVGAIQFPEPVDREEVVQRVLERESLCSTAMPGGVAVLHTARWGSRVLRGYDLLAVGRLSEPVDFGALDGGRTDVLGLVLAGNERNHLVLLTKLTRLCQEEAFVEALRAAPTAQDVVALILSFEATVFHGHVDQA
jgi:excisionase family DNA binding protein